MYRLIAISCIIGSASVALGQIVPASDPTAISIVAKSVAALTGGLPVKDITINATVTSILGSDNSTGTAIFRAKGMSESRVDLTLPTGTRTDVRNVTNGFPSGSWAINGATATKYAQHNSWTDAAWFFPVLGSLSQNAVSTFVFAYIGVEQHGSVSAQHVRLFQVPAGIDDLSLARRLTTMDFYFDPVSYVPLAVAFSSHADNDLNIDIPTETRFADYRSVNGILVPFHIQKTINGTVILDAIVTNAFFNSGLSDSTFTTP